MRGKLFERYILGNWVRITPADAGKTGIGDGGSRVSEDHPRGCGENLRSRALRRHRTGSPPRMRGKPYDLANGRLSNRITPADAGKTSKLDNAVCAR